MKDSYTTIGAPAEAILYKEKNSKFLGFAYHVKSTSETETFLQHIRTQHPKANHHCYAWRLGTENLSYRANDDGEPSHSAGQPIYGQILSFGLTNILVIVVRYFGGTKLGVGGLISAYKTTAQLTLESCVVLEKVIEYPMTLRYSYDKTSAVMRIINENNLTITEQEFTDICRIHLLVPKSLFEKCKEHFQSIFGAEVVSK